MDPDVPPWIVPEDSRALTANRYGPNRNPEYVHPVECLVMHYTAGRSFWGSVRWLCHPEARASAHFVVGRRGRVIQLAPLTDRTWHAGGASSRWNGRPVNGISLGIEVANLGPLTVHDGQLVDAWGEVYAGPVATADDGTLWEPYPDAQIEAVADLVRVLRSHFPRLDTPSPGPLPRIVGHQDVDPTRKIDPGPAFPWSRIPGGNRGRPA